MFFLRSVLFRDRASPYRVCSDRSLRLYYPIRHGVLFGLLRVTRSKIRDVCAPGNEREKSLGCARRGKRARSITRKRERETETKRPTFARVLRQRASRVLEDWAGEITGEESATKTRTNNPCCLFSFAGSARVHVARLDIVYRLPRGQATLT